ncbi:hypothetical protein FQA39_LY10136 [Lamprigera yunnana]|nr:hypothetical protein FQA39_LY10136 [Lamprigera yunnana]
MHQKKYQILAALSATISEVSDGMQYGWSAPVTSLLLSPKSPVPVIESQIVWIETCLIIGTIIGIPLTIFLLETFGRKQAILMATVQNLVAWILISVARSVGVIYCARILSGIAASVVFAAAPVYVAEIAEKRIRGLLSSFFSLMMLGGVLLVYSVAPFVSIPLSSAVAASFLVMQLVTLPFLPESPYYHITKGNIEKARKCLQRLRSSDDVEIELEEIAGAIAKDVMARGRLTDIFTVRSNRLALLIIVVLNAAQHLGGISVMLMNLHSILEAAALWLSPNTVAIMFGGVMWLAALIGSQFIDRFGRKPVLLFSAVTTGTVLILLAVYITLQKRGYNVSQYTWIPVILVLIYAASFRCGMGLIPIILTAELFPSSVKSIGVSLSEASFTVVSCVAVFIYPYLETTLGSQGPFYIFGISCFLTSIFVAFVVPETKGKSLYEIQRLIKEKHNGETPLIDYGSIRSLNNNID